MPTVSIDRQIPGWLIDTSKLRALAADVTCWSNCNQAWVDNSEDQPAAVVGHIDEDGNTYPVATIDCDQYYAAQDSIKLAKFYAAANPAAVLDLISEMERLRGAIDEIRPYLKDGETPAQRIERERRDTDAVLTLLAREKRRAEILAAALEEAESVLRSTGCDVTADACRLALTA